MLQNTSVRRAPINQMAISITLEWESITSNADYFHHKVWGNQLYEHMVWEGRLSLKKIPDRR